MSFFTKGAVPDDEEAQRVSASGCVASTVTPPQKSSLGIEEIAPASKANTSKKRGTLAPMPVSIQAIRQKYANGKAPLDDLEQQRAGAGREQYELGDVEQFSREQRGDDGCGYVELNGRGGSPTTTQFAHTGPTQLPPRIGKVGRPRVGSLVAFKFPNVDGAGQSSGRGRRFSMSDVKYHDNGAGVERRHGHKRVTSLPAIHLHDFKYYKTVVIPRSPWTWQPHRPRPWTQDPNRMPDPPELWLKPYSIFWMSPQSELHLRNCMRHRYTWVYFAFCVGIIALIVVLGVHNIGKTKDEFAKGELQSYGKA